MLVRSGRLEARTFVGVVGGQLTGVGALEELRAGAAETLTQRDRVEVVERDVVDVRLADDEVVRLAGPRLGRGEAAEVDDTSFAAATMPSRVMSPFIAACSRMA